MTNTGRKDDHEKLRYDLVPWEALEPVVRVLMHGAGKYGDDNWRLVPDHERRYFAAAMRHLVEHAKCQPTDPETGQSHLAHAVCCLLFMIARERGH